MTYILKSPEETEELGYEFARTLDGGETVCVSGGVGNGKSTFVRGIIRYLFPDSIYIPPILRTVGKYGGRLIHLDGSNFLRCGLPEEFLNFDGIRIIEHGNLWRNALIFDYEIKIAKQKYREVEIWQMDSYRISEEMPRESI